MQKLTVLLLVSAGAAAHGARELHTSTDYPAVSKVEPRSGYASAALSLPTGAHGGGPGFTSQPGRGVGLGLGHNKLRTGGKGRRYHRGSKARVGAKGEGERVLVPRPAQAADNLVVHPASSYAATARGLLTNTNLYGKGGVLAMGALAVDRAGYYVAPAAEKKGDDHPGKALGLNKGDDDFPGKGKGLFKVNDDKHAPAAEKKGDDHPGKALGLNKGDGDFPGKVKGLFKGSHNSADSGMRAPAMEKNGDRRAAAAEKKDGDHAGKALGLNKGDDHFPGKGKGLFKGNDDKHASAAEKKGNSLPMKAGYGK